MEGGSQAQVLVFSEQAAGENSTAGKASCTHSDTGMCILILDAEVDVLVMGCIQSL